MFTNFGRVSGIKLRDLRFLYFLVLFNFLPHVFDLPPWVMILSVTFVMWKMLADRGHLFVPGRWISLILAGFSGLGVFAQYGNLFGGEASTALLLLMTSIKLFEMKSYRDVMVVTYLCYFLLMSKLLMSQSISVTVFMVVDIVFITTVLAYHHGQWVDLKWSGLLARTVKLCAQAVPVVFILFVFFPRFSAGVWQRSQEPVSAIGFSDRLEPGSVSSLMQSEDLVFRAMFPNQDRLSSRQMYWRGAVLVNSQGLSWHRNEVEGFRGFVDDVSAEDLVVSEIILEPTFKKWLFALDWPVSVYFPSDQMRRRVVQKLNAVFESRVDVVKRELYRVYSQPAALQFSWESGNLDGYLLVDHEGSPQARKLAQNWKLQSQKSSEIVHLILSYFEEQNFTYSLSPPPVDDLDDFLFITREGFCEHYAGVMATLLRWAGVPSRVVVGFQGGTPSLLGDYLLVRQLDAHAWVEFWDEERSIWQRVDPTMVVAPERIMLGSQRYFDEVIMADFRAGGAGGALGEILSSGIQKLFMQSRMLFDQAESFWISFLLRYDFSYQQNLLAQLGLKDRSRLFLWFVTVLLLAGVWYISHHWLRPRVPQDPVLFTYKRLCRHLAEQGFKREVNEGPLAFKQRVLAVKNSKESQELEPIFDQLIAARYGNVHLSHSSLKSLQKQIKSTKSHPSPSRPSPKPNLS